MSKTVAGWFGRTHSKSFSKDINKHDGQGSEQEDDKENKSEKSLTKCESLPTSLSCMESDDDESQADQEGPCVKFNEKELGPLVSLKEQLEKDKEDESLRRWKAQLLGVASEDAPDGFVEPEVNVLSLGVIAKGRPDSELPLPLGTNSRGYTFSLKEGSTVALRYSFTVRNNIVSGLTCMNTVWKAGLQVDQTRDMMGTFAPQQEAYVHVTEEEVTPSGPLARGAYTARKRFIDDDGRVHLDLEYSFEIRKEW
ncbi:rho GDP-dissociation inhibitor 1 [Physcomitrium patens]|uniref:Rho GDP-dissociation inhibitor 1 n=1 Tax=Physcomitrium patens TaxID=3218 RepID=A0A2K1JZP8_PHYPA|nr:rho GDP-dissociation inhibitor 1-like [Physcomitrium patens]XP_024387133.1 rho GDP-dissociation inhibitor 1-like [Physcomitrium patens]XP_024387134.1 rho GDP-dissociation inhibitor 1-like [Physcomitrium patens]XP_024387136.1 rho GDP-dissociation inhibitor 1-like [Physcomitrium patens]XP_024387437.1 rho GDP-dissociation inhibitor 1-like [Physcomitrium patens]XP_024387439.1 rho GDP-dissociation inhibitor 1-like [Physcomitrium patens]XP_024387440.1 rho GDP-dissociation inhibitor 1-like [Physc|eukprot:XP_024387132.1 rho GDP-dissociation inhibitor 1-like [Physcomitrella patens]